MSQKENQMHRLSLVGFAVLLALPGCEPGFMSRWSIIEVTDVRNDATVPGASILASGTVRLISDDYDPTVSVAPTDELGRTLIPTFELISLASGLILDIRIQLDDRQEMIQVPNRTGAATKGEYFGVRVLDTDALAPDSPRMVAIQGSQPPVIEFQGYARTIGVCSNALRRGDRDTVWEIWTETSYYLDQRITVGSAPDGWAVGRVSGTCFASIDELQDGFTIYSREVQGNTFFQGASYCLDATGAVADCDR